MDYLVTQHMAAEAELPPKGAAFEYNRYILGHKPIKKLKLNFEEIQKYDNTRANFIHEKVIITDFKRYRITLKLQITKIIPPLQRAVIRLKDEKKKLVDSEVAVMIGRSNFKSDWFLCFYN